MIRPPVKSISQLHSPFLLFQLPALCHNSFFFSRSKASSSSTRWQARQSRDKFTAEAKVQGLMSRAAFKLMELDDRHRLFSKPGMTTVDLGFAPGSWSQVAVERSRPRGRVIGVDILPCKPPTGVSAIQGNFLSKSVQDELKLMLRGSPEWGRVAVQKHVFADDLNEDNEILLEDQGNAEVLEDPASYIDMEKSFTLLEDQVEQNTSTTATSTTNHENDVHSKYPVDLVLSDMCEPWPQLHGFWLRTINDPYIRMANTTGNNFRDHGLSIVSISSHQPFTCLLNH